LFVVSYLSEMSANPIQRIVKLDLDGVRLAAIDIRRSISITSAVTDTQGNLILAGADYSLQGIVLKLDPDLRGTLFSKTLPGFIHAVTVDGTGNIYVTGSTSSAAFPTTPGAFQTQPPPRDTFGTRTYAFLTEFSASGDRLL
jgi:hypothetical protein